MKHLAIVVGATFSCGLIAPAATVSIGVFNTDPSDPIVAPSVHQINFATVDLSIDAIAAATELSRKQVAAVLDSLGEVIGAHVKKNAVGEFVLPGLLKISTVRKPATKARKGVNPFTKEEVMFKAKPASTVVKVRPLKGLKDMAG